MFRPTVFTRDNFWRNPFYEFDRMFPDLWTDNTELEKSFSGFSTDVIEKDGNYILQAELPGFTKEDITIDLKNDVLTIAASHKEEKKEEDKETKYLRRERRESSYSRSFRVANVTPEDIAATYENGVLEVTFPKRDKLPEKEAQRIATGDRACGKQHLRIMVVPFGHASSLRQLKYVGRPFPFYRISRHAREKHILSGFSAVSLSV